MDHKVSKDMISSGMTPSGEKTQADLARTQYGSAPSPSRLMDAYKSMYEHHQKDKDGNTIPHNEDINEGKIPAGLQAFLDKKKGKKKDDGDEKKSKKGKGKPDFLDLDKDGDKKEPMKKASKEMKEGAGLYANIHAKRKRGGKMRKKGEKGAPSSQDFANAAKTAKEDVDMFDAILNHYVSEGYDERDVIQAMSSLTEEQLQNIDEIALGAIGTALKAVTSIAAKKGIGSAVKAGAAKLGSKVAGSAGRRLAYKAADYAVKNPLNTMYGAQMASGMVGSAVNKINPFKGGGGNQQPQARKTGTVSASADLFDIVKGQLIDEGLSEEEIKDIMLELTPEEILNEISVDKMSNYMSAANKDVQKTVKSMDGEKSVMGSDPRIKRLDKRATGMARAGQKIANKLKPKNTFLNMGEMYKNFDPKKPDPKQMAAQAKQEKNRQKSNDPMGVKNRNIGGQGLDPMDK